VRKLAYIAVAILLTGCVPIGVRVQNMLVHASVETAPMSPASVRSPCAS
jgi:hypothetical protein